MPRIRTIKPEFWSDEKLSPLSPIDRLVFLALISLADDAGRLVDSVKALDGAIFPSTEDTCRESLDTLAGLSRVIRYTSASGQRLLQIANWDAHQKVDKPSKYVLPAPTEEDVATAALIVSSRHPRDTLATPSRDSRAPTLDLGPVPYTNDHNPPTPHGTKPMLRLLHERDQGECQRCGSAITEANARIDWIVSAENGGTDDASNLRLFCPACAERKATPRPARQPAPKSGDDDPAFCEAWDLYPKRATDARKAGYRAWCARLNAGARAEDLLEGAKRYADYIGRTGKQAYAKGFAAFYGPDDLWSLDYADDTPNGAGTAEPEFVFVDRAAIEAEERRKREERENAENALQDAWIERVRVRWESAPREQRERAQRAAESKCAALVGLPNYERAVRVERRNIFAAEIGETPPQGAGA